MCAESVCDLVVPLVTDVEEEEEEEQDSSSGIDSDSDEDAQEELLEDEAAEGEDSQADGEEAVCGEAEGASSFCLSALRVVLVPFICFRQILAVSAAFALFTLLRLFGSLYCVDFNINHSLATR